LQPSELKPFYPSNPPKKGAGFYGTMKFDTTQNYVEDPESLKFEAVKAERKAIREKYGNTVFRPSSTPKSLRTSSVANHPRNQVCFKWLAMDLLRSDGAVEHASSRASCYQLHFLHYII
jgi:hypothetical protein